MVIYTETEIAERYNVTLEQLDKADRVIDLRTGEIFYQVASQTTADTYNLHYNKEFHKLSCECKAAQNGIPCWHKRAATAAQHLYRQTENVQARAEAEAAYKAEQQRKAAEAHAEVEKRMVELRIARDLAKKDGSFSLLK